MSQGLRPRKRARESSGGTLHGASADEQAQSNSTTDPQSRDLQHDEEYWLEDGNIVLVAGGVAFRVYRGLLASQSTVFADMFASACARENEMEEGCPVVHLSDSPIDVRHFLGFLLPKTHRTFFKPEGGSPTTFDQLSSITRLSHKYNVGDLEEQAISCLKTIFPDSYEDFHYFRETCVGNVLPVHAIGAVNLARLTGTHSILPSALYLCCQLGSKILDGWTREDGQIENLSPEDLRLYVDGRMALTQQFIQLLLDIFQDSASEGCKSRRSCEEGMKNIFRVAMIASKGSDPSALYSWSSTIRGLGRVYSICDLCEKHLRSRDNDAVKRVWAKLPELMGVEVEGWCTPEDG